MPTKPTPIRERFMSQHEPVPECGCWIWTGAILKSGYAQLCVSENGKQRTLKGHRVAWELFRGPIPDGALVLHRCDVRLCVNPAHLFLGGQAENNRDRAKKWRSARSKSGLPFGVSLSGKGGPLAFRATVYLGRRRRMTDLGGFRTIAEAHEAALRAKCEYHGCSLPQDGHPSILPEVAAKLRAVYGTEPFSAWVTQ